MTFFVNPDKDSKQNALAQFIDHTGNYHTCQSTCLSYVREDFVDNMEGIYIEEIPHQHLLTPIFAILHNSCSVACLYTDQPFL
jgi:hypothetical protein